MDYQNKIAILQACSAGKGNRCSFCPAFGKGTRNCRQNVMRDAASAITDLLARAEAAEQKLDAAINQLHHCENNCGYCKNRNICDKDTCFGASPKTGEPQDFWQWDKNA